MPPPRSLRVTVTHEDIRNGEPANACRCPVARAATRALGLSLDDEEVTVEGAIEVWTGDGWELYELPAEAVAWIEAFDAGALVTPLEFTAAYARFVHDTLSSFPRLEG